MPAGVRRFKARRDGEPDPPKSVQFETATIGKFSTILGFAETRMTPAFLVSALPPRPSSSAW
jgi:hypothetical protein